MDPMFTPEARAGRLAVHRGVFAAGYTPEQVTAVLEEVAAAMDLPLAVVWTYDDRWGIGGDSELLVIEHGRLWEGPDGLWAFLADPEANVEPRNLVGRLRGRRRARRRPPHPYDAWNYYWRRYNNREAP